MILNTVRLGDIATVTSSKRIFAHQYTPTGIPFYRQKEIIDKKNKLDIADPLFISEDTYYQIKNKFGVPQKGDLLITAVGVTLGIPYVVADEVFYFKDGNLIWLKDFDNDVNSKYIYYWITSDLGQKSMWSRIIGAAQPALTIDAIKQFEIQLPNIDIQNKIAEILSAYDDLIENNQKQIKLLEEAAQRLYKEWFVDLRFPGYEKTPITDGAPQGWRKAPAESFFEITIGKTPPRAESEWFTDMGNGIPWVSISDMGASNAFLYKTAEGLTVEAVKRHNVKIIPANTVLLSFKLTVGRVAITTTEMCTNEAIAHFRIADSVYREYVYCYLRDYHYDSLGSTSSISKAVNSKIIKAMPFVLPNYELITAFSKIVAPIFDQIKNKQKSCLELKQAGDRLLPKLMSGELEV